MAPIKRKGNASEEASARKPQKRVRVGTEERKKDKSSSAESAPEASELSVLRDDEPSFPRGGASVLTPLERKQIQIKATKDVLFEQKSGGKKASRDVDDEDDTDMEDAEETTAASSRKHQKRKGKGRKDTKQDRRDKQGVRIEGLSFKRLVPGTMVLGQVSSINAHDIALSLPNNLTGYVPLTAVSRVLETKVEKMLEEDEDENSDDEDFDLNDYFYLGQYLRAYVVSAGRKSADASAKSKKRIELSVDPRSANSGLQKSDIVVDTAVQASVVSVEDHGLIMDLGIEGSDVKGFMSSKEIDPKTDYSTIKEGSVFLCMVTGQNASGSVIKLSANLQSAGSIKKSHFLSTAPTINSFLPGAAAEILLTDVTSTGMVGKIMGMLDTTVDLVHSGGAWGKEDLTNKFHNGAKIKGRLLCTFPGSEPYKIGFSMLDRVQKFTTEGHGPNSSDDAPAISAIIPEAKIVKVDPGLGVYAQIGSTKHLGFVHVSRLADGQVETISSDHGPFKTGTTHEARVVGYSAIDNLYLLSFERKVIDQPFLRLEDVTLGAVVKATIDKILIGESGVDGLIVSLADGITGFIPSMHFADTPLQFPEKKFRQGMTISARVLSVNLEKRQIRLTLKKSLLNSESAIWKDYRDIKPGSQSPGTIINIQAHGAVVQFYGTIRAWLPVSEMSEAYISDPSQHFRLGQVVNVHALNVDASNGKLSVSCRDPSSFAESYKTTFENIHPGLSVTGTVFEKSGDYVLLKLEDFGGLVARLSLDQIADGSASKQASALSKIRVGQKLNDVLVLDIHRAHRLIYVTTRASLKKAAKENKMPATFDDVQEGAEVTGYVRNITSDGLFVQFLGGLIGLVPKRLVAENADKPDFGMVKSQVVSATVHSLDTDFRRFILSMDPAETTHAGPKKKKAAKEPTEPDNTLTNPIDESLSSKSELTFGRIVKCKIVSVKATQVNVKLADNVHGRIDVSEVFDKWEDIKDRKQPLRSLRPAETVSARILGIHDARSYRFLPISHRSAKNQVYELSMKPSFLEAKNPAPLNIEQVQIGSSWFGFVNNVADDHFWVNLTPNIRGRLRFIDATDDLSLLADVRKQFPIGCAVKFNVTAVDTEKNHIDLSARQQSDKLSFEDLSVGMVLPTRVTKVTERQIIMQINDTLVGAVDLINMADDYSQADPSAYRKNEVVRSCIIDVDKANKRISLSLRPSKVLSSSLSVQDPEITSIKQLKVNDVVRGFVRRVADNGVFVTVGQGVTAYVRISDLSDSYLKEWKDAFQVDQLVKGRVTVADAEQGKLQMSLKESVLDPNYKAPITLHDLKPGQTVTGKVRKVEQFGAFIVVDGSANISGLCHRTQMADNRVEDARTLYEEGDAVKAKILKIDRDQGKISFGLKASYFKDEDHEDESSGDENDESEGVSLDGFGGVEVDGSDDESDEDGDSDVSMGGVNLDDQDKSDSEESDDEEMEEAPSNRKGGLGAFGFDWNGNAQDEEDQANKSDSDDEDAGPQKKKKHRRPEIQVDRTGELDAHGPQSVADYERLLLGEPDSSLLWLKYMAFQLELGEVDKAREIAERALRTITIGQDAEKLNIWVAMLNLENTYGDDDTLEDVFKRACQYNDTQEIYERLTSIYIQSGKNDKADELFQTALKKKIFQSPKFFVNYASFLFDTMTAPDRGRALLPRALQSLPSHTHVETTSKFAQLEFRSPNGDIERGRTVFEGLLSSFPKRVDLWSVLLDLEIKNGDAEQVRRLFERVLGIRDAKKGGGIVIENGKKLRPKQARFFFKKWLEFEEKLSAADGGNEKMVEEIKAKAAEYVKSLQQE